MFVSENLHVCGVGYGQYLTRCLLLSHVAARWLAGCEDCVASAFIMFTC